MKLISYETLIGLALTLSNVATYELSELLSLYLMLCIAVYFLLLYFF